MTPTFTTEFDLVTKKIILTDTFDYSAISTITAYGNFTVKIGNQILHTNTNFNASADTDYIASRTELQIDLPLNADGSVREAVYTVEYDVRVKVYVGVGTVSADVAADTFTQVTIPSNPAIAALINALITAGVDCRATFNVGSTSGYPILAATSTILTFASTTIAGAAAGLTSAVISSTTDNETINIYNFCDITPIADLCVESDCFYATLTASDTTPYLATQTIVSRALTINWPRLANGNPVDTAVVTSEASQVIGPNLYTGGYLVTLSTAITWTQTDGLLVSNTVASRIDYVVNCDGSICSAFNCIKAYMIKYQQAVALGSRELAQFTAQNFQILLYCNLYNIAIQCQDTAESRAILVALGEYMSISGVTVAGCDCGCGQSSTNSTEPTIIYPLYNSAVYNNATETARGIAELATQTETNTGTDDTKIVTPLKLQKRLLDTSNTASGTASATLNKVNGVVTYSQVVDSSNVYASFLLNNSFITSNSKILWSINYVQNADEIIFPCQYLVTNPGIVLFTIGCLNGTTNSNIQITYTILNP